MHLILSHRIRVRPIVCLVILVGLMLIEVTVAHGTARADDYIVNLLADPINPSLTCGIPEGECTLRAAILQANQDPDPDTISFAGSLSFPNTLSLTAELEMVITEPLTIRGPTAGRLTVDGMNRTQHFVINSPTGLVTITNLALVNGAGFEESGGSIHIVDGSVQISNFLLAKNRAGAGPGGAIYHSGDTLNIINSTLSSNHADGDGGAIVNSSGDINIINSTISDNHADGNGGAIYNYAGFDGDSTLTIQSSTVVSNSVSTNGGGIYSAADTAYGTVALTIENTILAGNVLSPSTPNNCFSEDGAVDFSSLGYNLTVSGANTGCTFDSEGDQTIDPDAVFSVVLDPHLAANGGSTLTHALLPNSQAIDQIPSGVNGCSTTIMTDQRGVLRPLGPACDIGAYEAILSAIAATKTVGPEPECADTSALTEDAGAELFYCVTIHNTGNVTLTTHTIDDPALGLSGLPIPFVLAPDAVLEVNHAMLTDQGPRMFLSNGGTTNNIATVTSTADGPSITGDNITATGVSSATVTLRPVEIDMTITEDDTDIEITRTVTATVTRDGTDIPVANRIVGFEVTGGTTVPITTSRTNAAGQVTFKYISQAPTGDQPAAAAECSNGIDRIHVWVDLNGNDKWESPEPEDWEERCTAITLISFSAQVVDGAVVLAWRTAAEIDNAGYNLYRATAWDGPYVQINPLLIPGQGTGYGASYTYTDNPPDADRLYYKLEDVDYYGVRTLHGPLEVRLGLDSAGSSDRLYLPALQSAD